ncbi:ThuA domain-containing protein [Labedaea rhizosphaerae]|uniref:Ricin-type beta-trefoil lectin protein n=1 Tax=Labedaea rhizosphaerae TaxID=598644 RepID=A0A4R6S4U7_LABRH|nr:ThuA domain-containing protein [Labedaea rhizosphaerae]TDP94789.1 ricin-type beta-trefoil lectin protein [Labedaea rhizosphaerae]
MRRALVAIAAALLAVAGLSGTATATAPQFSVLAFYNGTYDAAHIDYVHEANRTFPQLAAKYGFSYEATNDWDRLDSISADQYQVVMFLDDLPQSAAQRTGFQHYMANGGAWFGFHVAAFTTDPGGWSWYHDTFLGSGSFQTNTWGPTTAVLKVEDATHPATRRLPATFTSGVSEWYSWSHDLRQNPDIDVLASVDPSSFPLGTDPNQSWYDGYYPILWTNKNFKMLYANFGHNAMNYDTGTGLSSTFADPAQDAFLIDGLLWLGGAAPSDAPTAPIDPAAWFTVTGADGACVTASGTANGSAVRTGACDGGDSQRFRFASTDGPWLRVDSKPNPAAVLDVTDRSTSDNAPIQLWTYGNGANQQWQAVDDEGGAYHLVNKLSSKCLTETGGQLTQVTCTGAGNQEFRLTAA